jgi:hypothetical protein
MKPSKGPTVAKRLDALKAKVSKLEKRNNDLVLKLRIVSGLFGTGSPLGDFFASDEFWENPYDSSQADCSRRCIRTLTAERAACQNITDPAKRQKCFQDASDRASRCHRQCAGG